ncbi:unnamed protein product [Medioppia subpectinata]|uniref:Uncharacterized protein n=1 Tax=Medioppia subpectinata TaxID=1979941 RepID=A0A7R9L1S9_9ACAR|nr:unnamed protein product [Medioppia subpectinata]CAG2113765.1 unnamed protein product [Medioppia subpectinata]
MLFVLMANPIGLELLTRHGWASAYTMEAVIMQLCASFVKGQARIKRTKGNAKEFSKKLAEASFRNVIKIHDRHGWVSDA